MHEGGRGGEAAQGEAGHQAGYLSRGTLHEGYLSASAFLR